MLRTAVFGVAALLVALTASLSETAGAGAPPSVQAESFYVLSTYDGAVLAAREPAAHRAVASITKLMTVLVALEHADLDDLVTVGAGAAGIGEATIFLRPGDRISVRDLIVGALVPSANDAATALALHVGEGSIERFVVLMNRKARALGLRDTHFTNPHGLDSAGHVSSARDAVRLARAALEHPFVRRTVALEAAVLGNGVSVASTDDLLRRYPSLLGGKTGHTAAAGWSQVAAARQRGVTVFAAVLGEPTRSQRNDDLEALFRWALREYRPVAVVSSRRVYATVHTAYDRSDVRLVALRPVARPARVGRPLLERVVARSAAALPVTRGQRLGEVRVYDGKRLVAVSPLVAAEGVSEPGWLEKTEWYARRTLDELAGLVS